MAWLTQAGGDNGPILIAQTFVQNTEREERYNYDEEKNETRERKQSIKTEVNEYRAMEEGAARLFAKEQEEDTYDGEGNRTVIVSELARANEAGAYTVRLTKTEYSKWSDWTADWEEE